MALNAAGYQTTGTPPGTSAATGSYLPLTGTNASFDGATQFSNGTVFLAYSSRLGVWSITTGVNGADGSSATLYSSPACASSVMPLSGWTVSNGTAPAPTFAAITIRHYPLVAISAQTQELPLTTPLNARIAAGYTYYSASSTLSAADPFQAFDTTSASLTVTLPDASTFGSECGFINIGPASSGHTLTYQCQSGQTLNGSASGTVGSQYMAFTLLPFYNPSTSAWGWLLKG